MQLLNSNIPRMARAAKYNNKKSTGSAKSCAFYVLQPIKTSEELALKPSFESCKLFNDF